MKLKDQVAVVTGGGGGLGESICLCLAEEGADIVVGDVKEDLAKGVVALVETIGRRAIAVETDVRFPAQCEDLIQKALKAFGKIDILVCCAGIHAVTLGDGSGSPGLIENIPEEDWNLTMDVNLKGVFLCNRAIAPYFKKQRKGKIINISSVAGRTGNEFMPHYCASKAGMNVLTQSVALQLAPFNINVNTVCPGVIYTPMWETQGYKLMTHTIPEFKDMGPRELFDAFIQARIPLKRPQTAESIGKAVLFFASSDADEITGQALNVDGGMALN
jgi:NAD(P)-dependent dehydrogenase (short-subunit alcohol dehydrogenase family)